MTDARFDNALLPPVLIGIPDVGGGCLPTVRCEDDKVARECARDGVDHPRDPLQLIAM